MKIGIDLGGSHIAIGLIENGSILGKKEYNFLESDKENLEQVIRNFLHKQIESILETVNIDDIEMIGISVPRKTRKRKYKKYM